MQLVFKIFYLFQGLQNHQKDSTTIFYLFQGLQNHQKDSTTIFYLFQGLQNHQKDHNQSMDHLINSLTSTKVDLSFEFQVNNCETISKSQQWNGENPFHFNLIFHNTQNLANQVSNNKKSSLKSLPSLQQIFTKLYHQL